MPFPLPKFLRPGPGRAALAKTEQMNRPMGKTTQVSKGFTSFLSRTEEGCGDRAPDELLRLTLLAEYPFGSVKAGRVALSRLGSP